MKLKFSIAIVLLMSLILATTAAYAQNDSSSSTIVTDQDVKELKNMKITLEKSSETPAVDQNVALENAEKVFPAWAAYAKSTKVEYVNLTDPDFKGFSDVAKSKNPKLREMGFMQDLPVYIITYKGLSIAGNAAPGQEPSVHHEYNVVVDATTGEALMGFSYR